MAKMSEITIELSQEVKDALNLVSATRLQVCQAGECVHNTVRNDVTSHEATCMLKAIYMTKGGACGRYEVKDAKD